MSRSYRKPWVVDGYKTSSHRQVAKRTANHKVRHTKNIASGKAYKKVFDSWNIVDYRWYEPNNPKIGRK